MDKKQIKKICQHCGKEFEKDDMISYGGGIMTVCRQCYENIWYQNMKNKYTEFMHFSKAGIVMTILGYFINILVYDILNLKATYAYWLMIPVFYVVRYKVYKKVGKATFGSPNEQKYKRSNTQKIFM